MTVATNSSVNSSSYPPAAIALHWIMAVLIAAVFTAIELKGYYPKGSETRALLASIHMMLGITVLLLVIIRIGIRSQNGTPPITPRPAVWQTAIAHLTHFILYAAMIGMPLLGWIMVSAAGHSVPFYGLSLPPIVGEDKALSHNLEEIHEFIGNALYYVIGLHAVGALFHHYVLKDNTLIRMVRTSR